MKQWALKSVVNDLQYDTVTYSDCHDNFIKWIEFKFPNKIDVIDIGGGNGRVFIKLGKYVNKYYSYELNPHLIEIGRSHFKEFENVYFKEFDIDNQEIDIKVDVIYIDSVLTMVEDPFGSLLKFKKVSDYTFINRTPFVSTTTKELYKWGGMDQPSTLWKFSYNDMKSFCEENKMEIFIIDDISFCIKNK